MLGEDVHEATLTASGLTGDRTVAVIDVETGAVASAKRPKLWRGLLALSAHWNDGAPSFALPDGRSFAVDDPTSNEALSELLQREVRLSASRPEHAAVARPAPEDVMAVGDESEVPYETLEIGQGTPGTTFVDFAPVHIVTSSTLAHVGAEMIRYRPNVILDTPGGLPFLENDWDGRELVIGSAVLRILMPTPRCAVPTLAHGSLPRRNDAVRKVMQDNRIMVPEFGIHPCLGTYAQVVKGATIAVGSTARLL
jgi:hypothetical protein